MKKSWRIILIHFILWLILSTVYVLSAESLIKALFPGSDSVETWLIAIVLGLGFIFVAIMISAIIQVRKIQRISSR